ncbi:LysM peptidoglycan-binding domain-containing protein [Patescibacteria group bacterium]|nr:LysM peptidoglycan-binding domain-containing protein [Patescibacteria group bacterium]
MRKYVAAILASIILFNNTAYAQIALSAADNFASLNLKPGDTYETTITIGNSYSQPTRLTLDAVDGTKSQSGYFTAKLASDEQFFFGKWATLEKNVFDLDIGESASTKITYKIPENATPGDYSGGITVTRERIDKETVAQETAQLSSSLKAKSRIAKAVYINIAGERISDFEIGNLTYKKFPGRNFEMYIDLKNKGNTTIKITVNPSNKSLIGETENLKQVDLRLLPQEEVNLPINIGEMPLLGLYDLQVNIKYSEIDLLTEVEKPLGEVVKTTQLIIIPWDYIILILFIILVTITFIELRKMYIRKIIKNSSNYVVQRDDTIASLAKKSNINWKILIKINHLNPPYEISPGQTILLPNRKK